MQGIAPMFIAGFSDTAGRRPAYIICFTIYLAANLGLALQNSYAALLVLRCVQSAGSSGTVALANGVVSHIVTSGERGAYIAYAWLGGMLGPSLSPVIGGLISQFADWHWTFWFLLIFAGVFFVLLALFLPETCRTVVRDGSIPPPVLNTSMTDIVRRGRRQKKDLSPPSSENGFSPQKTTFHLPSPLPTLKVSFDLETAAILLTTGLLCLLLRHHDRRHHHLPRSLPLQQHPNSPNVHPHRRRRHPLRLHNRLPRRQELPPTRPPASLPVIRNRGTDITNFNIEKARIEVALPMYYLTSVTIIAYGWVMGRQVHLAAPVILLFLCGWALNGTSQVLNALMVDIWPGRSAAATAANNLFRCELGAAASAAINHMRLAMGWGWAYTVSALISIAALPALWLVSRYGIRWRQRRAEKERARR